MTINYYAEALANGNITEEHKRVLKESLIDLQTILPKYNAEIIYTKASVQAGF